MGYGSSESRLVGNRSVFAELMDDRLATVAYVQGDSQWFNMKHHAMRWLAARVWRGFGIGGYFFSDTQPFVSGAGPNSTANQGCQQYDGGLPTSLVGTRDYSLGMTAERIVNENFTWNAGPPPYTRRFMEAAHPFLAPAYGGGRTSYRNFRRDATEYMNNRAFKVRLTYLKGPWGSSNNLCFTLRRIDGTLVYESTAIDMHAATLTVGSTTFSVPAMDLLTGGLKELMPAIAGVAGSTITTGTIAAIISAQVTFDDTPTGLVLHTDCSEGSTTLAHAVAHNGTLAWQAAGLNGITHFITARMANATYNTATEVTAAMVSLAASARANTGNPDLRIGMIGCYDLVGTGSGATTANMQHYETGFADYARSDPLACFLNLYAFGSTHENLIYENVWDAADGVHYNETGKARYLNDLNALMLEAAAPVEGTTELATALLDAMNSDGVNVTKVNGQPASLDTGGGAGGAGTGSGDFAINHSGGVGVTVNGSPSTADCMRFLSGTTGVDNVEVSAFLTTDYSSGNRGATARRGTTYSGSDGRWESPLMLDSGDYTLVASKDGYLIDTILVVVP